MSLWIKRSKKQTSNEEKRAEKSSSYEAQIHTNIGVHVGMKTRPCSHGHAGTYHAETKGGHSHGHATACHDCVWRLMSCDHGHATVYHDRVWRHMLCGLMHLAAWFLARGCVRRHDIRFFLPILSPIRRSNFIFIATDINTPVKLYRMTFCHFLFRTLFTWSS